jgi:hypothetical protein
VPGPNEVKKTAAERTAAIAREGHPCFG